MAEADRAAIIANDPRTHGELAERPAVRKQLDDNRHDHQHDHGHREGHGLLCVRILADNREQDRVNRPDQECRAAQEVDRPVDEEARAAKHETGRANVDRDRLARNQDIVLVVGREEVWVGRAGHAII